MEERIDELEIRAAHQEAAIEELTRSVLAQEQRMAALQGELEQLKAMLRDLAPGAVAPAAEETPPPHY